MNTDLDTLLTALYGALTDRIIPSRKVRPDSPGGPPAGTDAELVCLAVTQDHLGFASERRWSRAAPKLVGTCSRGCCRKARTTTATILDRRCQLRNYRE